MPTPDWSTRADAAESAVLTRHLRRCWGLPGTRLGVVGHPATLSERLWWRWHYWWQAHLLDAAVDAFHRAPTAARSGRIHRLARSIRLRNFGRWTNNYYDDISWLGLALHRAGPAAGRPALAAVGQITQRLHLAWTDSARAGIPWRVGDDFRNAPANGPAAILLARTGFTDDAEGITEWLLDRLLLPSGLIADGIRDDGRLETTTYTYCQGVTLGAMVQVGSDPDRIAALVSAVAQNLTSGGVLIGCGGGDGGLFAGILARYLALVATSAPGSVARDTRVLATGLVLDSARAGWQGAIHRPTGPVFAADWSRPDGGTADPSAVPERDLSVQLSGWLLTEAAATLTHR